MEHQLPEPKPPKPTQDAPVDMPPNAPPARVQLSVEVPPGGYLEVEIEAHLPSGEILARHELLVDETGLHAAGLPDAAVQAKAQPVMKSKISVRQRLGGWLAAWSTWLMGGSILIYIVTHLVGLDRFPIYFFTDEAVQTVLASDFLRDHLHNYAHDFLPTFFENGSQYNLGLSVYLQVLPTLFFGKSIWVTRGAAALVTVLAALFVGQTMKRVFGSRYPWLAVLFLTLTPAWFLHSRTAFETALATTFYAGFLYFYLLYRCQQPHYLYAAVTMGALTFYSYSPARLMMGMTALGLFLLDFGYHRRHLRQILLGIGLALVLALPLVRFLVTHPDEFRWQMHLLGSYWLQDTSIWEKLLHYGAEYLHGLDPLYWYVPNDIDLVRHVMSGYGQLLKFTLPLGILGLGLVFANLKNPAYRVLLVSILFVPTGAAMVAVGITRVLFMVIPMALVTALAAAWLMDYTVRRWKVEQPLIAGLVFLLLAGGSMGMLYDALVNSPTWSHDYTMNGMQWGARQLFAVVGDYVEQHPGVDLRVSPSWANGTDVLARFFYDDPAPFTLGNAESFYHQVGNLKDNIVFVLIPEEFAAIPREKFKTVQIDQVLDYPDGRPGFYFVHLQYVDNIADLMVAEQEARLQPVQETLTLDGQDVVIEYTRLDMGDLALLFDHSPDTLVRSDGINPLVIRMDFPTSRTMSGVTLRVGGSPTHIEAEVWLEGQEEPLTYEQTLAEMPLPRDALVDFEGEHPVRLLRLVVTNTNDPPTGHVHLWEISFR